MKLSLNEFERLFLRFRDMYRPEGLQDMLGKTEQLVLQVQWKMLYLEQLIYAFCTQPQINRCPDLLSEVRAPCKYLYWFKRILHNKV